METSIETSKRQGRFPFAGFLPRRQETGWLYSTPVSKKAYSEPVREEFSVAVDDRIVRRWRRDINEPFGYETFPGYLDIQLAGIIVPAKEIKKLLEKEQLLTGDDADIFIESLRSAFSLFKGEIEESNRQQTYGGASVDRLPQIRRRRRNYKHDYVHYGSHLLRQERCIEGFHSTA